MGAITIISFGFLHSTPPVADMQVDLRRFLADPAAARDRGILDLDGRDTTVQQVVCATPGAVAAVRHIVRFALEFPAPQDCVISVGCAGGKHRSVAISVLASAVLLLCGRTVTVEHRHVHLPRVLAAA